MAKSDDPTKRADKKKDDENGHKTNEKKAKRNEKGGASAMKEVGVEDAEREGIKTPASTSNVGQKKSGKRPHSEAERENSMGDKGNKSPSPVKKTVEKLGGQG